MPGFLLFFVGALMLGVVVQSTKVDARNTNAVRLDRARVANYADLYRVFVRHASEFMDKHPSLPAGSYVWGQIANGTTIGGQLYTLNLPPALSSVDMPVGWRVVGDGAGGYVICTPIKDERIAGEIAKILEQRTVNMTRVSTDKFVIGDTTNASALGVEAAKCAQ